MKTLWQYLSKILLFGVAFGVIGIIISEILFRRLYIHPTQGDEAGLVELVLLGYGLLGGAIFGALVGFFVAFFKSMRQGLK